MQGQNSGERATPKILLAPTNYLVFELPVSEIIYNSLIFFNLKHDALWNHLPLQYFVNGGHKAQKVGQSSATQ